MVSRRTQQQILFQTSNTDEIPNRTKINRKFVCFFKKHFLFISGSDCKCFLAFPPSKINDIFKNKLTCLPLSFLSVINSNPKLPRYMQV